MGASDAEPFHGDTCWEWCARKLRGPDAVHGSTRKLARYNMARLQRHHPVRRLQRHHRERAPFFGERPGLALEQDRTVHEQSGVYERHHDYRCNKGATKVDLSPGDGGGDFAPLDWDVRGHNLRACAAGELQDCVLGLHVGPACRPDACITATVWMKNATAKFILQVSFVPTAIRA